MHPSHKASKRPTIGFLVDNLFDAHEEELRRIVIREAEAADANLLCFLGGHSWAPRLAKVIYDLAAPENVDGIIAISGCLDMASRGGGSGGCFERDELDAFFRRYASIPIVSINKVVPGTSSLLVDN
ncbi:MAG TPA: hypothetical protein VF417_02375, partial [Candidatus Methylomirabilis sp.]